MKNNKGIFNGKYRVSMRFNRIKKNFGIYKTETKAATVWNSVLKFRLKSLNLYIEYYDLCKNIIEE